MTTTISVRIPEELMVAIDLKPEANKLADALIRQAGEAGLSDIQIVAAVIVLLAKRRSG